MDIEEQKNKQEEKILENFNVRPEESLTDSEKDHLKSQAREYKRLNDDFVQENFDFSEDQYYYMISLQFLSQWKAYVSYNEVVNNLPVSEFIGGPKINYEINYELKDPEFKQENSYKKALFRLDGYHKGQEISYLNVFVRQDIERGKDYEFVNEQIWNFFTQQFRFVEIKRPVFMSGQYKKIDHNLKRLFLLPIDNQQLRALSYNSTDSFKYQGYLQVPNQMSIDEVYEIIENQIELFIKEEYQYNQYSMGQLADNDFIRLWIVDRAKKFDKIFLCKYIKDQLSKQYSSDYKIWIDGSLLKKSKQDSTTTFNNPSFNTDAEEDVPKIIDEVDVNSDDIVIVDINQKYNGFAFYNNEVPHKANCENCRYQKILTVVCQCKKVAYCSQECYDNDYERFHKAHCDYQPDDACILNKKPNSKLGTTGLNNIGNTCFMNSGLQCMSNCYELTRYILEHRHKQDLNTDAPLGTKGELTTQLANIISKMWYDTQMTQNPKAFKKSLSKHHPIFEGYNQHDSQEFLTELLSSLMEDLNKILKKPPTESEDNDGPVEFWEKHVIRNKSIITFLFNGQFRSQLDCPDCQKISITYDPYLMISLPVPKDECSKILKYIYIDNDKFRTVHEMSYTYEKANPGTLKDIKQAIVDKLGEKDQSKFNLMATGKFRTGDKLEDDKSVKEVKQKIKWGEVLAIRHLEEHELNIEDSQLIQTSFLHKRDQKYSSTLLKHEYDLYRLYNWDRSTTLKDIHLFFFKIFKHFVSEFIEEGDDQVVYEKNFSSKFDQDNSVDIKEVPYLLRIKNVNYNYDCDWCGVKHRTYNHNCILEYTQDLTIGQLMDKCTSKYYKEIEFQIDWNKVNKLYDNEEQKNHSLIHGRLVQGKLRQEKLEVEQDGETPQAEENKELNLYRCLDHFQTPETLDEFNEVYCRDCKEFKKMDKHMKIQSTPQILVFHLKRFYKKTPESYSMKKINSLIDFPVDGLNMSKYVVEKGYPGQKNIPNDTDDLIYDLFAISNHSGSLTGGHYTAFGRNFETNKWYNFNDSSVTEVDGNGIVDSSAYVLFYRRRTPNHTQDQVQQFIYDRLYDNQTVSAEEIQQQIDLKFGRKASTQQQQQQQQQTMEEDDITTQNQNNNESTMENESDAQKTDDQESTDIKEV